MRQYDIDEHDFKRQCFDEYNRLEIRTTSFTYYYKSKLLELEATNAKRIETAKRDCMLEAISYIDVNYDNIKGVMTYNKVSYDRLNEKICDYICDIFTSADKKTIRRILSKKYKIFTKLEIFLLKTLISLLISIIVWLSMLYNYGTMDNQIITILIISIVSAIVLDLTNTVERFIFRFIVK